MRIFTDTNFLLSALVFRGFSTDVFNIILKKHRLVYSAQVRNELMQKLKFKFSASDELLEVLSEKMNSLEMVSDHLQIEFLLRDKEDEVILASAIHSKCDILLTGDKDLLEVSETVGEIEILSPREFWKKYHEA